MCYAVGDSGTILKTTDGATWASQKSGIYFVYGVACPSASTCYAVGDPGMSSPPADSVIFKTSDGATWTSRAPARVNS
jgi:photosystem II stability/assembly factor-like uncharacterized protein